MRATLTAPLNLEIMRQLILTKALVLSLMTSLVGLTQVQELAQLYMFGFGALMSLFMLGLVATEK
jgi:hypothetical protein